MTEVLPDVLVGVPVYRGTATVAETLESLRSQTYPHFRVLISVDGGDDESAAACRPFTEDPRFEVVVHEARLGWSGNLNWLVRNADLPFFCFLQQDDLIDANHLERLHDELVAHGDAAIAYADVQWFGARTDLESTPSLLGSAPERVLEHIFRLRHEPLLGMMRAAYFDSDRDAIAATPDESAQQEFVFLARLAARGAFHRVDDTRYRKRADEHSSHRRFLRFSEARRRREWIAMGAGLIETALGVLPEHDHAAAIEAIVERLAVHLPGRDYFYLPAPEQTEVSRFVVELATRAKITPSLLESDDAPNPLLGREIDPIVQLGIAEAAGTTALLRALDESLGEAEAASVAFGEGKPGLGLLGHGWGPAEPGGVWSLDEEATLILPSPTAGEWTLTLTGATLDAEEVRVEYAVDGGGVAYTTMDASGTALLTIRVPEPAQTGPVHLRLVFPDAEARASTRAGGDPRRLSVYLTRFELARRRRVALVTTATTSTIDAAAAMHETARRWWPDADCHVLASGRLRELPSEWKAVFVGEIDDTPFLVDRILDEDEQVALMLPRLLRSLTESYEVCVWVSGGHLVAGRAHDLMRAAGHAGTAFAVPARITPRYTLTPAVGSIEPDPPSTAATVIAVTGAAERFLEDWAGTLEEAVLDVDQRSIRWAADQFLRHSVGRSDVVVEGEETLLHWSHYASVGAGRAEGPSAALIDCLSLVESIRRDAASDDPEVAWSLLVHRVHDSRPIQPFLDIIEGCQRFFDADAVETPFHHLRAAVRRAADPFGRRWKAEDDAAFEEWLFEANSAGCTRLAHLVTLSQGEILEQFPEVRFDPSAMRAWIEEEGRDRLGYDPFDPSYSPRVPQTAPTEDEAASGFRRLVDAIRWRWTTLKTVVPGHASRGTARALRDFLGPAGVERTSITAPHYVPSTRSTPMWGASPRGLNLIGPFRSESGLGQAARASLGALRYLGRPFNHVDVTEKYPSRNAVDVGLTPDTYGQLGDVNLIHSNADEMITMSGGATKHRFGGRFNAAMWFWESGDLPMRSRPALHIVDELWVASSYQRDVFGQYGMVPVHVIGLAAELPELREVDRARLGWGDDELVFLFVYDALSSYGRKNPHKAIEAFIAAFGPRFERVRFVLKVSNLNKFPLSQREILGLAERYPAITVIDEYLARTDVLDLMAAADVYVSLHAAEGFGLTLLESMAMGTPVICTAYSGNMDFTTEHNSWLVGFDMMRTEERTGPYPEGSIWASPSVESAAEVMRHVAANREEIVAKGKRARPDARHAASLERYAERLEEQLKRVL